MPARTLVSSCAAAILVLGVVFTPGIALADDLPSAPVATNSAAPSDAPSPTDTNTPAPVVSPDPTPSTDPTPSADPSPSPDPTPSAVANSSPSDADTPAPSTTPTSPLKANRLQAFAAAATTSNASSYTVPAGVTAVTVTAWGGQGGAGSQSYAHGGYGGGITSTITVTPGQVLQLNTGSYGGGGAGATGPWGSSGPGGGASDVRVGACAVTLSCGLADRVIVAGGGGGAAGPAGFGNSTTVCGGEAGARPDGSGNPGCRRTDSSSFPNGGGGGTLTAGGNGGTANAGYPATTGSPGVSGFGGAAAPAVGSPGGGGGDGFFGGGGGASGSTNIDNINGGGGGGGSNWASSTALATAQLSPTRTGDGSVTVTPLTATTSTTTSLTLQNASVTTSAATTLTATVSPAASGGTVSFDSDLVTIAGCATVAVVVGVATCTTSWANVGSHGIRATFSGSSTLLPSTSTTKTQTITQASTATSLVSSLNPVPASTAVTFTATVSPAPSGGTVAFSDNSVVIASCSAVGASSSTGVATCTIVYPSSGTHSIVASYSGTADSTGSTSTALSQAVVGTVTSTTLTSDANPIGQGGGVTYKAVVSPAPTSGTMKFFDNGTTISTCAAAPVDSATGIALCNVSYAATGSHPITAVFSGSSDYATSTSGTVTEVVNSSNAQFGASKHLYTVPAGVTAIQVTAWGGQGGAGSQSYAHGGYGGGILSTITVTPGQVLQIDTGSYGGGGAGATGPWGSSGPGGGASDVRVGACAATLSCGLADRVVVAGGGGGAAGPAGFGNTSTVCGGNGGSQPDGSGQSGCRRTDSSAFPNGGGGGTLTAGGNGGTANSGYPANTGSAGASGLGGAAAPAVGAPGGGGGDGFFGGGGGASSSTNIDNINGGGGGGGSNWAISTALATRQLGSSQNGDGTVSIAALTATTPTTTSLSITPTTQQSSASVTFTATISPSTTTGTVSFTTDGAVIPACDAIQVIASVATCTTSFQPIGVRAIRALYSGTAALYPSTSSAVNDTTTLATTSTVITSSSATSPAAQAVTYTATVSPVPTGGTVTFSRGGTVLAACTNVSVSTISGMAGCSETYLTSGDRTITAVYSGDANYATSTSADFVQHVVGASTTTSISTPQSPSGVGKSVTFSATVSPVPNAGTMAFSLDSAPLASCSAQPVSTTTGIATCLVPFASVGSHTLAATYSGATDYSGSTSTTLTQSVVNTSSSFTPGTDTFTVPAGWHQITVTVWGAQGGTGSQGYATPGNGGGVTSVMSVTPGQVLQITSGRAGNGAGQNASGPWGVSGGGGGASDVRTGTCAATASCGLAARILVGGGGGGAAGPAGYGNTSTVCGGDGGAQSDGSGNPGCRRTASSAFPNGGGAGTLTAGGNGGTANAGYPANTGAAGVLGYGGNAAPAVGAPGGAGGDGFYGGGGGASSATNIDNINGGGGGGGSSYISSTLTTASLLGSGHTGDGVVTIDHTASQLVLSGSSTSDLVFGGTRTLTATLEDSSGNPVTTGPASTAVIGFTSSGAASFSGLRSVSAVAGVATITVTATGVGAATFGATGSSLSATGLAVNVVKAPQTITFADPGGPRTYGTTFTVAPTASSGGAVTVAASGGCSISANVVTMTSGTTACSLAATQSGTTNYTAAPEVDQVVSAAKAAQAAVTLGGPSSGIYGNDYTFTASGGSGTGGYLFTTVLPCGSVSNTLNSITVHAGSAVGSCSVQVTRLSDANYLSKDGSATMTLQQRQLTVNAGSSSKVYGAADPVLGYSLSGFATGDTAQNSGITGSASCVRTPNETVDAGSVIYCSIGTLSSVSYSFVVGNPAGFDIRPAPLTITASSTTVSYGDPVPAITPGYAGLENGDTRPSTAPTCVTSYTPASPVDSYASSCGSAADDNYSISYVPGTVTVLTTAQVITFGQPASPAVFGGSFDVSPTSTSGLPVTVAASGGCTVAADGPDWRVTITSGTIDCTLTASQPGDHDYDPATDIARTVSTQKAAQAAITVMGSASVVYAGSAIYTASGGSGAGTFTFALGAGSVCDITVTAATTATVEFTSGTGSCDITATRADDADYLANSGSLSVAAVLQPLTIDGTSQTVVYGIADPTLGYVLNGFVNGDDASDITGVAACARVPGTAVGHYATSCSAGTLASPNYSFSTGTAGDLAITPADLTITASDATIHHGDAAPVIRPLYVGLANGDTQPVTAPWCSTSVDPASVAGDYASTCSGAADANYTVAYVDGTVTVLKAAQSGFTVTSPAFGRYGTTVNAVTTGGSGTGSVSITTSGHCTSGATPKLTSVGDCVVTAVKAADGSFESATASTTVNVTPAALAVNASPATKVQGTADPALAYTVTGSLAGDSVRSVSGAPVCSREPGEDPGSYAITCQPGTLAAQNYTVQRGSTAEFIITAAPATSTVPGDSSTQSNGGATKGSSGSGDSGGSGGSGLKASGGLSPLVLPIGIAVIVIILAGGAVLLIRRRGIV